MDELPRRIVVAIHFIERAVAGLQPEIGGRQNVGSEADIGHRQDQSKQHRKKSPHS